MILLRLGRPGINLFQPKRILVLLWLFLLVLPKGGFKIGGVPITWGYLLLGITALFIIFRKNWTVHAPRCEALLCLLPFQIISLFTLIRNGVENIDSTIAFLISFFILPTIILLLLSHAIETLNFPYFFPLIKKGIIFISCYGIFLFLYKQFTGEFIEIPFLTINWNDLGNIEHKCINRGIAFKLISTYNNGNIFGIAILMLLPIYCNLENKKTNILITKTALILTLSRTVWIGLFIHEVLYYLFVKKEKKQLSLTFIASIGCTLTILMIIMHYYGLAIDFIFDANLGGRREQLDLVHNIKLLSIHSFTGIPEMVYIGMLDAFGILGIITYLLAMLGPICLNLPSRFSGPEYRCLILGLLNYLIISIADGAILYIPIMAFWWFLIALLTRTNLTEFTFCRR
jgi:hypothetical protein